MGARTASKRGRRLASHALGLAGMVANEGSRRLRERSDGMSLDGDRWVEWSFCMARMSAGAGSTLDFGADIGFLSLAAAQRGHDVVALDREPPALDYTHPSVTHVRADILERPLADRRFDQIVNCSSIEHVGLAGRYGSVAHQDGDIEAMRILAELLAPDGRMILTIPVGRDLVSPPLHRIYGPQRLPRLLEPFATIEEQYWCKAPTTRLWTQTNRETALDVEGSDAFYALGLLVLTRA